MKTWERIKARLSSSSRVLDRQTSFRGRVRGTKRTGAFTLVELLLVFCVIGVLIYLTVPEVSYVGVRGQLTGTLNNARQLQLATGTMSLDTFNAGGTGPAWTGFMGKNGPQTVEQYFAALVKGGYLSESDLVKLLTAPGKGPGADVPTAQNSCFKFFAVDESSPVDQPLMVTANWSDRRLTTDPPYGVKGFITFTKGGSGGVYTRASDAASMAVFPVGKDAAGHAYSYEVLK